MAWQWGKQTSGSCFLKLPPSMHQTLVPRNMSIMISLFPSTVFLHTGLSPLQCFPSHSILMSFHLFLAHSWKSHFYFFLAIFHFFLFLLLFNCEKYFLLQKKCPYALSELASCCSIFAISCVVMFNVHPEMSIAFRIYGGRNTFDVIY